MALLDRNGSTAPHDFIQDREPRRHSRPRRRRNCSVELRPALKPPAWLPHQHLTEPARLPLLCEIREGYQNLCQLITRFKMRETTKQEGAAKFADLEEYASGLVCLTGGDEGPLAAALTRGGEEAGAEVVERSFVSSDQRMSMSRSSVIASVRKSGAIRRRFALHDHCNCLCSRRMACDMRPAYDREILDLFTAIRNHTELDRAGRLLAVNSQRHLRAAQEMVTLFRDVPGAVENTVELSSRLKFELSDLGYEFPRYPVPDGETMDSFLRKRVEEGVMRRYGPKR